MSISFNSHHPKSHLIRDVALFFAQVRQELDQLEEFHDRLESWLTEAHGEFVEKRPLTSLSTSVSSSDNGETAIEELNEELARLADVFPNTLRRSILFGTLSVTENALIRSCQSAKNLLGLRISPRRLRGEGIPKLLDYLILCAGWSIDPNAEAIGDILTVHRLRNGFYHRNGEFGASEPSSPVARTMLADNRWFYRSVRGGSSTVLIQPEFCRFAMATARDVVKLVEAAGIASVRALA